MPPVRLILSFGMPLTLVAVLACYSPATLSAEEAREAPVVLRTADVAPRALVTGTGFTIGETVSNDGYQNTYTLNAGGPAQKVTGNGALAARILEIQGTLTLQEIQRSDAFKEAVKATAHGMVDGGKSLVTSPVETTKSATKGLGRWLGNVGRSATSDDPHQENAVKTLLGHDSTKRAYALELGVDPYTDYEPFQKELGEVSRVATSGGLMMSVATDEAATGVAGSVVSVASIAGMKDILVDEPPSSLARINREKLEKMGITEVSIDALLRNYNYTPMEMTLMVESLRRMGDIEGRDIFVTYATSAPDRLIVRYVQESAEMLANYINRHGSGNIVNVGDAAWFLTDSGKLVATQPMDYLLWTEEVAGAEDIVSREAAARGIKEKELWIEGRVDPGTRKVLTGRGWTLKEEVGLLPGAS